LRRPCCFLLYGEAELEVAWPSEFYDVTTEMMLRFVAKMNAYK